MNRLLRVLAPVLSVLLGAGCSTMSSDQPNLVTVPSLDLDRYLGRWYVIAYTPNFLETEKSGPRITTPAGPMEN